jgi:hypothetical protein
LFAFIEVFLYHSVSTRAWHSFLVFLSFSFYLDCFMLNARWRCDISWFLRFWFVDLACCFNGFFLER